MSVNENTQEFQSVPRSFPTPGEVASVDSSELDDLANRVGDFVKYWGFKRVHGQIWVHLFLSKEPLDAGELIRRLHVSKALISMSLSDLLSHDVVRRAGKSEYGTQQYVANDNIADVIISVLKQRERKLISEAQSAQRALDELPEGAKAQLQIDQSRLEALGEMTRVAESMLDALVRLGSIDCSVLRKLGKVGLLAVRS